jgi:hypothetical protein
MRKPNNSVETSRRPASALNAMRQFESASSAWTFLSAAVAYLCRSAAESDAPIRVDRFYRSEIRREITAMTTIANFSRFQDADLARLRLEAAGITTFLPQEAEGSCVGVVTLIM